MLKNVAGQIAQSQMVTATDGSAFTGTVTAYVTGDGGTQAIGSVGSGIATHEGNGLHTYAPAQAETNFDNVAFTFIGTGAIPATEQYTTGFDMIAISGDTTAADNLELQYDTTGLSGDNFPATQEQVSNLAVAGAASNTPAAEDNTGGAIKGVSFVGSQTNTFVVTKPLDGIYHIIDDSSNAIDIVYGFDVGGDGVPIDVTWIGYLARNGDSIQVFGYDFIAAGWVQIGTVIGKNQATDEANVFTLFTSMVGTSGADTGKVYVRFEESAQGALFSLNTNQIFVSFASVPSGLAYQNGSVWIDTVNGAAGTVVGSNGTITNPVNSIADARIIADAINLRRFNSLPGTSFILAQSFDGYEFFGAEYIIDLNGQSISGSTVFHAGVIGNDDGTNPNVTHYDGCYMNGNSLGAHILHDCALQGDMVLVEAADYFWDQCFSAVAGTGTPSVDFEAAAETKSLSIRHYSGGMEYKNFGNTGTHNSSIEGHGQIILNASCAGGVLAIRGHFTIDDNASGAVTVSDDARYDVTQIEESVWDAPLSDHNIGGSTGKALRQVKEGTVSAESEVNDASATTTVFDTNLTELADDFYLDISLVFIGGALTGQSRTVIGYVGATKTIILDEPLTSAPADGDGFIIKTDHVHPISQIVEGVWDSGTGATVAAEVDDLHEIEHGDRVETSARLIINRAGTSTAVLDKEITGSLLPETIIIGTTDT